MRSNAGVSCVHPLLAGGKLQRIQFGNMDTKLQHKNTAYFISIKLNPDGKRMRVKAVRFQVGPIGNSVKKFVLQYHDEDEKPHSINDKNDQIVVSYFVTVALAGLVDLVTLSLQYT